MAHGADILYVQREFFSDLDFNIYEQNNTSDVKINIVQQRNRFGSCIDGT